MKTQSIKWKILSGTLVLLTLSLIFSVALIWGSMEYQDRMAVRLQELEKNIAKMQTRKKQSAEQEQRLAELRPRFEEFRKMGSIGDEPRLRWVEAVQELDALVKLPVPIRFKLDPPQPFVSSITLPPTQEYMVLSSRMELNFGLLHEEDLANLLNLLQQKKVGIFHVNRCKIQPARPLPENQEIREVGVNLEGSCALDWLTLRELSK